MTIKSFIQTEFLPPHLRLTDALVVYGLAHCYPAQGICADIDVTLHIED